MADRFAYFLPITKVEKQADGSRVVRGYASTPTRDLDGEIVALDAVKAALPSYMEWRAIRQMHQPIAVGTAKEAHVDDAGLYLSARIVDPNCVKLIDEEVLKGFSIGGKKLSKKGDTITEIELIEVSVVDRPANPDCRFEVAKSAKDVTLTEVLAAVATPGADPTDRTLFAKALDVMASLAKAVQGPRDGFQAPAFVPQEDYGDDAYCELGKRSFSTKERREAADKGEAMPDGSFPIKSKQDLHNAVQAFGRAKNKDKAKAHIIARAKSLGATDALPADWEGSTKEDSKKGAEPDAATAAMGAFPGLFDLAAAGITPAVIDMPKAAAAICDWPEINQALEKHQSAMPAEVVDRIAKGMGAVADLAYAFSSIRSCQRRLIMEGLVEKDGDDQALAAKLGQIASELAEVIGQKATQEGSEAVFMTDEDDLLHPFILNAEFAMTQTPTDLLKRARAAVKAHFGKAAEHLRKAGKACADGMDEMNKAGAMFVEHAKKAAEAQKAGKKADELDMKKLVGHLGKAHKAFGEAQDHQEMAHASLAKAASAWAGQGGGTNMADNGAGFDNNGDISNLPQGKLTEGEVPWYEADQPYHAAAGARVAQPGVAPEGFITKREADLMAEKAKLEGQLAAFQKSPAGPRRAQLFTVDKNHFAGGEDEQATALTKLMDGVTFDANDPASVSDAAGKMIGNMIANAGTFGRSVLFDRDFRGQAGAKRAGN